MQLGERCDEIVRLIDETLAEMGVDCVPAPAAAAAGPSPRRTRSGPAGTASARASS